MAEVYHPTKLKLIEKTAELLLEMPRAEISSEMILSKSGISKGSMYHHFEDLDHLIEIALLERYAKWIDVSVSLMTKILTSAKSGEDIYRGLSEVTRQTQDRSYKSERFFRAEILVMAQQSPRFFKELSTLQDRLTDSLTDLVREAQERGFYKKTIDARAIAVFIQAYTLGKIIDDSSENPVDPDAYAHLINTIIKEVFLEI